VRCASCNSELIEGKPFCPACGAAVSRRCRSCGAEVGAQFRFCTDCGKPLAADAPSSPPRPPAADDRLTRHIPAELARKIRDAGGGAAGERKLVTVLFCDLVGSTSIAERLDPEEYHDLLDEYLELAFREVYQVEGIVNQLAGDGFMALFGAPLAHEDAPHRAVSAALAIRDAVARFSDRAGRRRDLDLLVRIGVHTGPVVVGAVGSDLKTDYSAIGDTTNLAARLQSLAEPGTVLVSQTTERLVRGFFETRDRGPLQVKGKSQPIAAFEVVQASGISAPMAIAEVRGLTPLVGRNAEVSQLVACFGRVAERLPQVIAVVGDAGSGKSRLVYELRQRLAVDEHLFFEARCSSLSQALPYAPMAGMLRQFFEILPGEAAETAREKIAARIGAVEPSLEAWMPFLWNLLGVSGEALDDRPAEEIKQGTIEAVCRLTAAASRRAPAVLVVEDLHWMDDPSREMVEVAVSRLRRDRMMILTTHRPDFQPHWRTQAAFTRLTLRRLVTEEAANIARAVAGGPLPAELERSIVERAEGNPFYLEELTRALLEEGVLLRGEREARLVRPLAEIRVPATVHEILAARLDRLGAAAKRVVQVASVLGRQFSRAELEALVGDEGITVERELAALEQRGILHRKAAAHEDEYRFGESLTQEVAYEGLLLKERRQLHDRVAVLVLASPGEDTAERSALIAHHLARGEDRARAIEALLAAARSAERLPSYRSAAGFYREGWEIADLALEERRDGADRFQRLAVQCALGLCRMAAIYTAADLKVLEPIVLRGIEIARELGDTETRAALLSLLGNALTAAGRERFAEGLRFAEEGVAVAEKAGLSVPLVARGVSWINFIDGRFDAAERATERAIEASVRAGHRERLSDLYFAGLFMHNQLLLQRGRLDQALAAMEETYRLAVKAGNRTVQAGSTGLIAWIHLELERYAEANELAARFLELAQPLGNVGGTRTAAAVLVLARAALGEPAPAGAGELLEMEGLNPSDLAIKSHLVSEALIAIGDLRRAQHLADLAYRHAGGRLRELWSTLALGEVKRALGPAARKEAEEWIRRASTLANEIGSRWGIAATSLATARASLERGDRSAAEAAGDCAWNVAREIGFTRLARRAERILDELRDGAAGGLRAASSAD
jgi:class 3 adenylate cyclase/tetratricopeptide (TPR) repeat protein/ABC-type lipoprotein export system ATPase subunit